jgi:indole-3-glycerol phosphate synthase
VLRKDFTIDEYQIYEARAFGADAILLIAAVLTDEQLLLFSKTAGDLGMSYIIEVHTAEELERVMSVSRHPLIIGINNRDLKTMRVDISTTFKLIKFIPKTTITVSESGIRTKEDIGRVKESGVNAVLVGESLMSSGNIASKIKELLS